MESILILGAGVYQVPLIKKAREMGYRTVVVSYPGRYPGFQLADKVYYEDTRNIDAILAAARQENVVAATTTGTDVAVPALGKVCDELQLPGPSFHAASVSSDKRGMKRAFLEHGVTTPGFREATSPEEVRRAFRELNHPVMVKPPDSSGSRGITRVEREDDLAPALQAARAVSKVDTVILEEYVEGQEFGVQAIAHRGDVPFLVPHGDMLFSHNGTSVPIGHFLPCDQPPSVVDEIHRQVRGALDAMALDNCALNVDLMLCDETVYILELSGRAGATCLPELVSIHCGLDYYEQILRLALDQPLLQPAPTGKPCAAWLLTSDETGTIAEIRNDNKADPAVEELLFDYGPGDPVSRFRVGPDRVGHVVVSGSTLESALRRSEEARDNVAIRLSET